MKKKLKKMLRYIVRQIGRLIYNEKYIQGKYFDEDCKGWRWIISGLIFQKILGVNRNVPWPVSHNILINNWKQIKFHPDDLHIFQTGGSYFQAQNAEIVIGKGTWIAPNVGLITTNHDIYNLEQHDTGREIILGEQCWIGMNSVILPGVELGPHTIVGAGAVVTKSFIEGYCIIGGVPAVLLKKIDRSLKSEN